MQKVSQINFNCRPRSGSSPSNGTLAENANALVEYKLARQTTFQQIVTDESANKTGLRQNARREANEKKKNKKREFSRDLIFDASRTR